jgi:hypothetical protein
MGRNGLESLSRLFVDGWSTLIGDRKTRVAQTIILSGENRSSPSDLRATDQEL